MIKLSSKTKFILALLALVAVITTLNVPFDREPKPQTTRDNLAPIEQTTPEREEVISPYDSIIRRVALRYGYDWRFISAVAYTESKFNQSAASNAGAVGLMQITPIVAERYGAHIDSLGNPALNIELGVKLLAHYGESFTSYYPDVESFINANGGISPDTRLVPDEVWELYAQHGGNIHLDGAWRATGGHTVFGQVYAGMDVVDAIAKVETGTNDKPTTDVIIESIEITTYQSDNE